MFVSACLCAGLLRRGTLASVLEDIATNGYPAPEAGVLWEAARDAHLATLADKRVRVA
ncbi:hypothetical protein [Streptomyces sp. NPDC051286]|uniref:hypothetical protein n=1 Tax=Streptomyces sp. NPDC051286 TaxID=3365647 RepID=UPI0037BD6861